MLSSQGGNLSLVPECYLKELVDKKKKGRREEGFANYLAAERGSPSDSLESLWSEYFSEPSQRSQAKGSPWNHGLCDSCWVQDELGIIGKLEEERDYGAETRTRRVNKIFHEVQSEEEDEEGTEEKQLIKGNQREFQDDFDDAVTVVALIKTCAKERDLHRGSELHADVVRRGLFETNVFVGSTLVSMYAKCGALEKAQEVFDGLPIRNVVSWNALIAGYAQHGQNDEALTCYTCMQLEGFSPNAVTFVTLLKACGSIGALDKGQEIHDQIIRKRSLEKNFVVANALVDMYVKCGALEKAQEVLEDFQVLDNKSLNDTGESVRIVALLKACAKQKDLQSGSRIYADIARRGLLDKNVYIGSILVSMYAKCGALEKAQEVFDRLSVRNVVSWNALIAGYVQHGHSEEAINCYERMQLESFSPNTVTFVCLLKACGSLGASDKGQRIHDHILREHLLENSIEVSNALIDMYAKCGELKKAQDVFDELEVRDIVSWTALMAGYAQHEHAEEALKCYEQMQLEGFIPNAVTFVCILKACGSMEAVDVGEEIHSKIAREHLLETNIVVANALIDMYAKCGALEKAQEVFDELRVRNVVSWNVLIAGYAQNGHNEEALKCYERMQREGFSPDTVTFLFMLKVCGNIGAAEKGIDIHADIIEARLLDEDIHVGTAVVDMYAKCGLLAKAQEVFDEFSVRDVVLWTALIIGYAEHEHSEEALYSFDQMQVEGFFPDAVTFACILKACGSVGAACKAQGIHAEVVRHGLLEKFLVVGTALVEMYANHGMLAEAQDVFDKLPVQDVVSWSALLEGYCQLGKDEIVFNLFDRMISEGIEPTPVTFTIVLNSCSHGGLLDKGQMYFETISKVYGSIPSVEHHTCVVDLFCRAGHSHNAVALIEEMPIYANLTLWLTLLGACQKWEVIQLGRWAFKNALQLDKNDGGAYVCMSNIYAAADRQDGANGFIAMRIENQAWKTSGCSWWVDTFGAAHLFSSGDQEHPQTKEIYRKLESMAYTLSAAEEYLSQDIFHNATQDVSCGHSEKLAIACALINTSEGTDIWVFKSARVCPHCHSSVSLISKIVKRRIFVRDTSFLHIFEGGRCACEDY